MGLGKLPVPGRPTIWITVRQGPTTLAVGAGGGCLDILNLIYPFSPLSPSLWETARYRLKYCLKGPLNPKQPINQPTLKAWKVSIFKIEDKRMKFYSQNTTLLPLNLNPLFDIYSEVSKNFIESLFWFQKTRPQTTLLSVDVYTTFKL